MASMCMTTATEFVTKARESAFVLKAMLGQLPAAGGAGAAMPHGLRHLTEQILSCCDRALATLHSDNAAGSCRKRKPEPEPEPEREGGAGLAAPPAPTTLSKRMRMSRGERWTRVEKKGTMEDGFMWRKYGQKDIHGSNYPRLYFRCTYKDDRGCKARRRVQQSDTEPSVYLITYFDEHTCHRDDDHAVETPAPFVINFGLCTTVSDENLPRGSPWLSSSSCDDDDGPVETHTSSSALCSSPEEELQAAGTSCDVAEFIVEQSTPVPELRGMMTLPEWDPMDGCLELDWEFGKGESSSDIDGFVRYDFDYIIDQL